MSNPERVEKSPPELLAGLLRSETDEVLQETDRITHHLGVLVGPLVKVGLGGQPNLGVCVLVAVGVSVGVGGVPVIVGVGVKVLVGVLVGVRVRVGVFVGVEVRAAPFVIVGVSRGHFGVCEGVGVFCASSAAEKVKTEAIAIAALILRLTNPPLRSG